MPYIRKEHRVALNSVDKNHGITKCSKALITKMLIYKKWSGILNYMITTMLNEIIKQKGESYDVYNNLIGVLENVKLELYRRKVAKYEDEKIKENGDVY